MTNATSPLTIGIDARKLRDFGIGRYVVGLLRGFAALDTGDRFVVFAPDSAREHDVWRDLPADRFRRVRCDAGLYSLAEVFAFTGVGPRHGIEVLHFPHYVRAAAPGCAVAVTIHDAIHLDFAPNPVALAYAHFMMRWSIRTANPLLTVSDAARDDLVRRFGARAADAFVTPNGVDATFHPHDHGAIRAFRAARGLAAPFVALPASHRPHKNLRGGAGAFRASAPPGWELVVPARDAAAAERLHEFQDASRPFRVLERVTDHDLSLLYASAEFVLAPSLAEGFGLVGLEALASGGVVLATPIPPQREVLADAAAFASSTSTADLADALRALSLDSERRARLRALGPPRAARFDWRRTAERTLEAYRHAVVGTRRRS